jgi:monoamine oxidase
LGIGYFEQYMDSSVFYETSNVNPTPLLEIPNQPPSFRISGGTSSLIDAVFQNLNKEDVFLNQKVSQISFSDTGVKVQAEEVFEGSHVVLAIPPKLWANKITFTPALPIELVRVAQQTQTWMEDSIKVGLTYEQPFWEKGNLPRTLFSNLGPVTEFYDHGNKQHSTYALCGFVNGSFSQLNPMERRANVIKQITAILGKEAETFTDYLECVWSQEENTHDGSDSFLYPHQNNGHPIFREPLFGGKLLISSSESSAEFPGYMDGAVNIGLETAEKLIKSL